MKHVESEEIKLRLGDMLFTWDDEKERINIRKHRLDFTVAASVFLDCDAFFEDNSIDEYTGEERFDVIGMFAGPLMYVVYVERVIADDEGTDIIRIISARDANKEERKRYVNGYR